MVEGVDVEISRHPGGSSAIYKQLQAIVNPLLHDREEKSFVKRDVWSVASEWIFSPDMEALTGYPGSGSIQTADTQRMGFSFSDKQDPYLLTSFTFVITLWRASVLSPASEWQLWRQG
jgi:hypothetical protein